MGEVDYLDPDEHYHAAIVVEPFIGAEVDVGIPGDLGAGAEPAIPVEAVGLLFHAGWWFLDVAVVAVVPGLDEADFAHDAGVEVFFAGDLVVGTARACMPTWTIRR